MAGKVVKQLAGSGTGQSLSDMMNAVKLTLLGSVVVKVICKATTEEMSSPKKKHLMYLVKCTYEPRLSIPDFANHIIMRTQHSNPVVVFKALVTIHDIMQYGNERFCQYIASNNCHLYVPSLHDRNSVQAHVISVFVRPYAKYLDEKAASYREVAFDFCRLKRGKDDSDMRTMSQEKLFKTLPVIEKQLKALLLFEASPCDLVNPLINVAHLFLYRDLIRIYAVYNEGMINLVGRYFNMPKRDCRVALELYKNFLKSMESMNAFVKIAETHVNAASSQFSPDSENSPFQPVPPSVLESLEQHLNYLESHKSAEKRSLDGKSINSQISPTTSSLALKNDSNYITSATNNSTKSNEEYILTEIEKHKIIEEERARLESFINQANQRALSTSDKEYIQFENQSISDSNFVDLLKINETNRSLQNFQTNSTSSKLWFGSNSTSLQNQISTDVNSSGGTSSNIMSTKYEPNLLDFSDFIPNSNNPSNVPSVQNSIYPVNTFAIRKSHPVQSNSMNTTTGTTINNGMASVLSSNPFLCPINTTTTPNMLVTKNNVTNYQSSSPSTAMIAAAQISQSPFDGSVKLVSNSNLNPDNQNKSSISLDDKIAQLAGNLSIRNNNPSDQSGPIYRAPDGSLTSVNWTGTMPYIRPVVSATTTFSSSQAPVRLSASMNQISNTSYRPPFYSNNLWAIQPQPLIPINSSPIIGSFNYIPQSIPTGTSLSINGYSNMNIANQSTNPFL